MTRAENRIGIPFGPIPFGTVIRASRIHQGISERQLAGRIGRREDAIAKIESSGIQETVNRQLRIVYALGFTSVEEMMSLPRDTIESWLNEPAAPTTSDIPGMTLKDIDHCIVETRGFITDHQRTLERTLERALDLLSVLYEARASLLVESQKNAKK